jgi:hypothetical protein
LRTPIIIVSGLVFGWFALSGIALFRLRLVRPGSL